MAGPAPSPLAPTPEAGLPPPQPPAPWREQLDDLRRRALDGRWVVWAVVGMAVIGVGLWLLRPSPTPVEEVLPVASTTVPGGGPTEPAGTSPGAGPAPASTAAPAEVVAHAAGAVARPGVYRLHPPARVDDLVRAAGGLAPDADPSRLNLAALLADGARVYVPRAGEEVPPALGPDAAPPGPPAPGGSNGGTAPDDPTEPIDLNTADETELDRLPGVGPATAAAIVAFREESGGFRSVDDLLDVRGIGEAKLEQLRPLVTVG